MGLTPLIHVGKQSARAKAAPRKRGAMQSRVLAELRHGLMVGAFVPGQTITLRRLAELLGTSPMPVREAINQLTAANVLEILPNGSVAVPRMSAERFKDLTRVRQALEGLAAEMACANATPDLVRELTSINVRLRETVKGRHILRCLAMNQEFHFTLYGAARSVILSPLIESLWLQAGPIMYLSLTQSDTPWDASCHDEVVAALKTGNPVSARRALQRDIGETAKSLLRSSIFRANNGGLTGLASVR